MKQLLSALALAALATACQPQTATQPPQAQATPAATEPAAITLVNRADDSPTTTSPVPTPVDATSAELLKRYNLASVLQTLHDGEPGQTEAMNGFYGPDHYRMEMVLTKVTRDPANFNRYLVEGKDRYKGIVTPLTGTIDLTRVWTRQDSVEKERGKWELVIAYAALGSYELREDPTTKGAGVFRGKVAADITPNDKGEMVSAFVSDSPTKNGSITYEGTWTSLVTGQQKAATWVENIMEYQGLKIMDDLFIGERDPSINPKYAKLGWNKYWENDEWWVESPKTLAQSN